MGSAHLVLAALGLVLISCAPCSEDPLEPNDEESPADGGELSLELNEADINFHDQHDVDCIRYAIPDPGAANEPRVYVEVLGADEDIDLTVGFSCSTGEPASFKCGTETADEPSCAKGGKEPNLSLSYDCDGDDDAKLGDATIVVCATRPSPDKLCIDYTVRAFLN